MSKIRIGINGFGRIGRQVFRALHKSYRDRVEVVAINDLFDAETNFHLLEYDSVYGRAYLDAKIDGTEVTVGDWNVHCFAERDPKQLAWGQYGVDIVVESTGIFRKASQCSVHIENGAKKVIITAPAKEEDITIVMGVNHQDYDPAKHHIVSNASCTTNCLAPVAKVLNDNWGIKRGLMTTVHAATATQKTVDGPSNKDWRGGRGILENIIPSSTGAAKAVGVVIPELNKKLTGMAFRVPTSDVSVVDLTVELEKPAKYEDICKAMKAASEGAMKGVLGYTEEKVVATDFRGEACTSTFDAEAGIALDDTFVKVVAWYDNEWGYSCKVLEMIRVMSK